MKSLITFVFVLVCMLSLISCDNNTEIAPESRENNREVIMESDIEECCGPILDYENNEKYFVPGKFQPNSDNSYIHDLKISSAWQLLRLFCKTILFRSCPEFFGQLFTILPRSHFASKRIFFL